MDEKRRAAWEAAVAKLDRGDEVPPEDHYALLREGMFKGFAHVDCADEADLFLKYWFRGHDLSHIPWLGEAIANHWFWLRDWDRWWGRNRADEALRNYITVANRKDFDHWTALNAIAARLQRERQPFPDALADWAAERHEGKHDKPPKPRGGYRSDNKSWPPYATEDRDSAFFSADSWLEHFGMTHAKDRLAAIAGFAGPDVDEDNVRDAITRVRDRCECRAPWPR